MVMVFIVMFISAICIAIGFRFKMAAVGYVISYCYIMALDKSYWNNHSYLFALIASLLAISDANQLW